MAGQQNQNRKKKQDNTRNVEFSFGKITDTTKVFELPVSVLFKRGNTPIAGANVDLTAHTNGKIVYTAPHSLMTRRDGIIDLLIPMPANLNSVLITANAQVGNQDWLGTHLWKHEGPKLANNFSVEMVGIQGTTHFFRIRSFSESSPSQGTLIVQSASSVNLDYQTSGKSNPISGNNFEIPIGDSGEEFLQIEITDKKLPETTIWFFLKGTDKTFGPFAMNNPQEVKADGFSILPIGKDSFSLRSFKGSVNAKATLIMKSNKNLDITVKQKVLSGDNIEIPITATGEETVKAVIADPDSNEAEIWFFLKGTDKALGPFILTKPKKVTASAVTMRLQKRVGNSLYFIVVTSIPSGNGVSTGVKTTFSLKSNRNLQFRAGIEGQPLGSVSSMMDLETDSQGRASIIVELDNSAVRGELWSSIQTFDGLTVNSDLTYVKRQ